MERSSMVWMVDYLLNSAWHAPLVLLVALLAGRLVARLHSVAASHRVWVAALALATVLPASRFDLWPGALWWHAAATGGRVQVTVLPGAAAAAGNLRLSPAMMAILLTLYVAATLYFAGRFVWSLWKTEMLRRNASAVARSEPVWLRWEALCASLGVRHAALRLSPDVSGPAVVGARTVLLPSEFIGTIGADDLDAALAHELAHVQRGDFVKNLVYAVLALPVAYHPCIWLLRRGVEESREMVCDAIAAEALDGSRCYARSLLRLAAAIPAALGGRTAAAVGIFEGNSLERRVRTMMDRGKQLRGGARRLAVAAVLLAIAGAAVAMAGTHLTVQAADSAASNALTLNVKASVMEGNLEKKVMPKYPAEAKAHHNTVDGAVTLGLFVNEKGAPTGVHVVKSLRKDYDQSAIDAVRQWRWKPYLLNGNPVRVETRVNVVYRLAK